MKIKVSVPATSANIGSGFDALGLAVTLYNTAIPEYLPEDERLVCRSLDDMIALTRRLVDEPETFRTLSGLCSRFIREKCGAENTTERERKLFLGM